MKARRVTVELGMLGGCSILAGLISLAQAADQGRPELGPLAAVLGVLVVGASLWVIGLAVHRLRGIEGLLPETARRVSPPAVAARVSLACAVPLATLALLASTHAGAGWILGSAFAVLGAAIWTAALLATHVEYLSGARVWRSDHRFYFAR
jgi:hypothetical protein